jgi:hypothetical protein
MFEFTTRPIDQWPGALTTNRRRSQFKAGYSSTLTLLDRELSHLNAKGVVVMMALGESEIRVDGRPYVNAKPRHPGIILACTTKYGPFRMVCDRFDQWQDNLRAIALSLEHLRAMDRYGCTKRGEQYRGWQALPSPNPMPATREEAYAELGKVIGEHRARTLPLDEAFREAAKLTHPDAGGSAERFKRIMAAKEILEGK